MKLFLLAVALLLAPLLLAAAHVSSAPTQDTAAAHAHAHFAAREYAEALPLYEQAVLEDPASGVCWFRLGYCAHASGKLQRAIEAHSKAANFPSFAAHSHYNMGCEYALIGEPERAFAALERAIAAGFDAGDSMAADEDLISLRADPRFAELLRAASGEAQGIRRQFDFWLGTWEVFDPAGQRIGSSRIESAERGNLVLEHWTDATGRTGRSMNYVDPLDGMWHQLWVSDNGMVSSWTGSWRDGAMRLQGSRRASQGAAATRMSFTPAPDGSVRQFIEDSPDGGDTWKVSFDGTYRRKL